MMPIRSLIFCGLHWLWPSQRCLDLVGLCLNPNLCFSVLPGHAAPLLQPPTLYQPTVAICLGLRPFLIGAPLAVQEPPLKLKPLTFWTQAWPKNAPAQGSPTALPSQWPDRSWSIVTDNICDILWALAPTKQIASPSARYQQSPDSNHRSTHVPIGLIASHRSEADEEWIFALHLFFCTGVQGKQAEKRWTNAPGIEHGTGLAFHSWQQVHFELSDQVLSKFVGMLQQYLGGWDQDSANRLHLPNSGPYCSWLQCTACAHRRCSELSQSQAEELAASSHTWCWLHVCQCMRGEIAMGSNLRDLGKAQTILLIYCLVGFYKK